MVAYRLTKADNEQAFLYMYDVGTNTWQKPYSFPRHHVLSENTQYVATDTQSNTAVTSYQQYKYPFNPNEVPPTFVVFDASNGELLRKFAGLGEGYINGMAIDSTTGTMCTTTFGDKGVEFYKVSTGKGFAVQIPVLNSGAGPLNGGAAVAVDQVNHLFLIAQLNSTFSSSVEARSSCTAKKVTSSSTSTVSSFSSSPRRSPRGSLSTERNVWAT